MIPFIALIPINTSHGQEAIEGSEDENQTLGLKFSYTTYPNIWGNDDEYSEIVDHSNSQFFSNYRSVSVGERGPTIYTWCK